MSAYIRVELQQEIRKHFGECCTYCRTAEFLTAMTFELLKCDRGSCLDA